MPHLVGPLLFVLFLASPVRCKSFDLFKSYLTARLSDNFWALREEKRKQDFADWKRQFAIERAAWNAKTAAYEVEIARQRAVQEQLKWQEAQRGGLPGIVEYRVKRWRSRGQTWTLTPAGRTLLALAMVAVVVAAVPASTRGIEGWRRFRRRLAEPR